MKIGSLDYNSTLRGVVMRCQASSCKLHGCICDCKRIFYNDIGGGFGSSRQFWKPGSSTVIVESPRPPLILKVMTQPWGFYIMLFIAVSLSQMKFGVPGPQAKFPNFWQRLAYCQSARGLSFLGNALSEHRMLDIYGLSIERADRGRHVLAVRCCIGSEVWNFNPAAAFWQLSVRAIY